MPHPYFAPADSPRILAHRGLVTVAMAADGIAENSFAAVAAAHAAGATYVESDCHLTRDGVVVLFHDSSLRRVLDDPREVADVSADELSLLMADRGGLITLQQALEAFPDLRFNIDVKSDAAAVPAGKIVAKHAPRVLLTSFDDVRRRVAVAAATGTAGAPATSPGQNTIIRLLAAVALGIRPLASRMLTGLGALQIPERQGPIRVLTRPLIRAAHAAGVEVHVWTVNDVAEMERLVALGVDGIVTDRADLALDRFPPPA